MLEPEFDRPLVLFVAVLLTLVVSFAGARLGMEAETLIDTPNERSSHHRATSRAGGVAIFVAWVAGLFVVFVFARAPSLQSAALAFSALSLGAAGLGYADDQWGLTPLLKLAGQIGVAALSLALIGALDYAALPFVGEVRLGAFGGAIALVWIVAFMNVFNFMDGLNGIAGGAAAAALFIFSIICLATGAPASSVLALLMAVAILGFLPANVFRQRLFMGDCGSHLIAFVIAGLAVFAANESAGHTSALILPVIFIPFILDVAFTLTHRLMRGQNVMTAHREHIYQLMHRLGASHGSVAASYVAMIVFCAGLSILMLTMAPQYMGIVPVITGLAFLALARQVYARARKAGLISPGEKKEQP